MQDLGRLLVGLGVLLLIAGGVVLLIGRAGLPLGRLPGDIVVRGRNVTFYAPITTCIVISVLLSLVIWLLNHFRR